MKGMQKISRGSGFRNVVHYVFKDRKARFLCSSDLMMSKDAVGLTREFRLARAVRPGVAKPVWHQSLRLPEGEIVAPAKFRAIAHDYMAMMGFDCANHQYMVVMHGLNHVHIIASRVGLDGKLWYGRQENLKSTAIIQQLETRYGLQATKGPEYEFSTNASTGLTNRRIKRPAVRRPQKKELERNKRLQQKHGTSELLPRLQMLAILNKARQGGRRSGMAGFLQVAEAAGVNVQFRLSTSQEHNDQSQLSNPSKGLETTVIGIAFELATQADVFRISGSKLGADYSGPVLSLELGNAQSDLLLLQERTTPFGHGRHVPRIPTMPYSKPILNQPKESVHVYQSSYTPMAGNPAAEASRRRNRQRAQTVDGVYKLPGSALAFPQLLRHDQVVCFLPGDELHDLDAGPRAPTAGLRRVAGASQTSSEARQPDTGVAIERAEVQHQLRQLRAREIHDQALAQRLQWMVDATRQSIGESADTAYLQAAAAFLTAEKTAQRQPDAGAWRAWDQAIGIDLLLLTYRPGQIEEALTRLSPAGLPSIDEIERRLNQGEQNMLSRTSYGVDAMNLWGAARSKAPKAALQSVKASTQAVQRRAMKPR